MIYQTINNGYDTYDSAIVVAEDEEQAIRIHPTSYIEWKGNITVYKDINERCHNESWAELDKIQVEYLGIADKKYTEPTLILSSYNAG